MSDAADGPRRHRVAPRTLLAATLLALSTQGHAQEVSTPPPEPAPASNVPTLDKVQALRPDEEVLDLYTFDNPITVDSTRFSKAYNTGITPEQMALDPRYGGYVIYGINQGLLQTWKGIKKVTHMRPYEQPAIARPPPLTQDQMRRAVDASRTAENALAK